MDLQNNVENYMINDIVVVFLKFVYEINNWKYYNINHTSEQNSSFIKVIKNQENFYNIEKNSYES